MCWQWAMMNRVRDDIFLVHVESLKAKAWVSRFVNRKIVSIKSFKAVHYDGNTDYKDTFYYEMLLLKNLSELWNLLLQNGQWNNVNTLSEQTFFSFVIWYVMKLSILLTLQTQEVRVLVLPLFEIYCFRTCK